MQEKLSLHILDIWKNIVSQSLKTTQHKTLKACEKVIMQIHRPCVNTKLFTSFSKDFRQTTCWLILTILVIILLYSCLHCVFGVVRTAVTSNTLRSTGGQQGTISQPTALSVKGGCCWPGCHKPCSQPSPCLFLICFVWPWQHSISYSSHLDILGKGIAKGGNGFFSLEEELYLLVFIVIWEEWFVLFVQIQL